MRTLLLVSALISGCTTPIFDDIIKNKYFEVDRMEDPDALYIGEWTSANAGGIYTVKINPNGTVIACQRTQPSGTLGKIFLDDKGTAIIYEGGTIERIVSANSASMVTDVYDMKITYHTGDTPAECRPIFDNHMP